MRFWVHTGGSGSVFSEIDTTVTLGRGGVAVIHPATLSGEPYAAKIFRPDRVVDAEKIMAMIANPPDTLTVTVGTRTYPQYAWPTALLRDSRGAAVGFLMPLVDQTESFTLDHFYDKTLIDKLDSPEEAALSYKLEVANNLSALVSELHKHGHFFIDLKPQNIRVFRRTHIVTLIDCDGFSIQGPGKRFPAEMLSTDYIAPEAARGNVRPQDLAEPQDLYALAVILFQLLNGGTHPFQGIVTDANVFVNTNDEKAVSGLYPHGLTPNIRISPRAQSIHTCFDDQTRRLFDLAFTGPASLRPTAAKWAAHFKGLLDDRVLVRCDAHRFDIRHMRFQGKQCPTCYLESVVKTRSTEPPRTSTPRPKSSTPPASRGSSSTSSGNAGMAWVLVGIGSLMLLGLMRETPKVSPSVQPSPSVTTQTAPAVQPSVTVKQSWQDRVKAVRQDILNRSILVMDVDATRCADAHCLEVLKNGKSASDYVFVSPSEVSDLEESNTWWTEDGKKSFIKLKNSTRRSLAGIIFENFSSDCSNRDRTQKTHHLLTFKSEVPSGSSIVLSFDFSLVSGCGNIVGAWYRGTRAQSSSSTNNGLPQCSGSSYAETWTNCVGARAFFDGSKYVGGFKDGKRNGHGTYTWANGDTYVGAWVNDNQNGHGVAKNGKGDVLYSGPWVDGKPNGAVYLMQTRVAEGLRMALSAKLGVSENAASGVSPLNAGLVKPPSTETVSSLTVDPNNGVITIRYTSAAGGGTLLLTPTSGGTPLAAGLVPTGASINWDCFGGTTPAEYRPSACRRQ